MELYLARDDEGYRLDSVRGELVRACDLAFRRVDGAPRDEAYLALWVARLVPIQRVQIIALILIVPNVPIALPSVEYG